ncbi:MAG: iron-dependent extradiol dioxygenase HsaC [Nocardioides sp.]|jgi:3,4-dihydroxy-9,10-secoandrosta-1,3,5(10)-triene-9,17-dione 4,5-dioxygenase
MGLDLRSLGYVRVESTDVPAWRTFALDVLGLAEARGPDPDHLYLRMDELSARIVVAPGERDRLTATGWEVADHWALAAAVDRLKEHGVLVETGTPGEIAERRVQEMVRFNDPFGNVLELFHGATYEPRPVVTPYGTSFVTGAQGLGHLVLPVTDDAAALRFYGEVLGFRLRDSMRLAGELVGQDPGSTVWLRFLGCNPRHHSLALAAMPAPAGCVHIMLEVDALDDVGRAMERARRCQAPISATLGRHMNDHMLSFYVRSPGGFDVEYGADGLQVDDTEWVARESTAVSAWGHRFDG